MCVVLFLPIKDMPARFPELHLAFKGKNKGTA